jgi:hypothetical protein
MHAKEKLHAMKFEMTHLDFPRSVVLFDSSDPPSWLVGRQNSWFYEKHILTLEIGQSKDTDFRNILRVS